MNFKNVVLLIAASLVFVFATLVSWYEGGQLRDISWEWEHTAVFSNWFNGEVDRGSDIIVMDHFVYAAKFEPFFPFLMAVSLLFIVFRVALWIIKDQTVIRNIFFLFMAATSFSLSGIFLDSPATGFKLFSIFFGIIGILSLFAIFLFHNKKSKPGAINNT
ncbi:DUF4306 domain-containing protein [Planococcus shenhongbingii]|uniref:DUF4306 domain-containing protein n=1 Tax=Planococcus shenhongbingii TaxID=3058398 RepID=UPI00265B1907|nr:DUF4306 domain-containing protein [Planococcus sp. N017]